ILSAEGSFVLPVDTPYDRQQLVQHVLAGARGQSEIELYVDRGTWIIKRPESTRPVVCSGCGLRINHAVCRPPRRTTTTYCVACAVARPRLTLGLLLSLSDGTMLRDVQAHYMCGRQRVSWTRWPQATPAEVIADMRLQRRFAPVLTWRCAEIRLPPRQPR
ncbi:MAG: hypothetical protein ACRENS_14080, partial [Candidatus Eiseniibacteriota bacterium]